MDRTFKLLATILFFVIFSACRETSKTEPEQPKSNHSKETTVKKEQISNKHVSTGGAYSFERPKDFGLAVNPQQILVKSVIPPCPEGFDYCLYYNGKKYENTNFESAGVGFYVLKSMGEIPCFSVEKYQGRKENLHTETINGMQFTVFSSGDAATGHYANDVVYQTFQNGACYQFVARIGSSQFANYDAGSIEKFDKKMEAEMRETLKEIIRGIQFNSH